MFEKLGYNKSISHSGNIGYCKNKGSLEPEIIVFAINKKCNELGWM